MYLQQMTHLVVQTLPPYNHLSIAPVVKSQWPAISVDVRVSVSYFLDTVRVFKVIFLTARKLKCDGGRPQCLQCIRRSVDCEYEPTAKRRGLARPSDAPVTGSEEYPQGQGVGTSPRVAGGDVEQGVSAPPKSVACQFCRGSFLSRSAFFFIG